MANKFLSREDAPITAATWEILDQTMLATAKNYLSGRRILNIEGPYGLGMKAVSLRDPGVESGPIASPVLPLAFMIRDFNIAKRDLAAFERDGIMLDTKAVYTAAIECAKLEDELIYKGTKDTPGLLTAKGGSQVKLSSWAEVGAAADDIIKAVTIMDNAGFYGPYAIALSPARYNLLLRRYPNNNYSELEHIKTIVAEGIVKAPAIESGGLLLATGKQYASIIMGQDMAVGYVGPTSENLEFSITESLTPYVRVPKALCLLKD
jgi:uncharacterized linocin/CFP29 family protein